VEVVDVDHERLITVSAELSEQFELRTGPDGDRRWPNPEKSRWLAPCAESNEPARCSTEPPQRVLLIESVPERRDLKIQCFQAAFAAFGPTVVLASNTSTLPISSLGEQQAFARRLIGMHFCMPVETRPLLEIILPPGVDPDVAAIAHRHTMALGFHSLVVGDAPGFVVNRMLVPYLNEAMHLLGGGIPAERLERAATSLGMPWGPCEMIDLIGAETAYRAGRAYWSAYATQLDPHPLLPALVKHGLLGRDAGRGFYAYAHGQRSEGLTEEMLQLIQRYRTAEPTWTDGELRDRLGLPMWLEAHRLLQENVVGGSRDVDTALQFGLDMTLPPEGFMPQFEQDQSARWHRFSAVGRRPVFNP
jgi:3-hydroxyacyl-CoA dehydrogenase